MMITNVIFVQAQSMPCVETIVKLSVKKIYNMITLFSTT